MTKAVEPYPDEEWKDVRERLRHRMLINWDNHDATVDFDRVLATIEADREKLAEKDARIAELETWAARAPNAFYDPSDKWVEDYSVWVEERPTPPVKGEG